MASADFWSSLVSAGLPSLATIWGKQSEAKTTERENQKERDWKREQAEIDWVRQLELFERKQKLEAELAALEAQLAQMKMQQDAYGTAMSGAIESGKASTGAANAYGAATTRPFVS
jgi:ABC-type enterochelin transport system substrate-binding protein